MLKRTRGLLPAYPPSSLISKYREGASNSEQDSYFIQMEPLDIYNILFGKKKNSKKQVRSNLFL